MAITITPPPPPPLPLSVCRINSSNHKIKKIVFSVFLALGVSEAIASANTVFVDNSTNPPSLSIEGNEENVGLGLIVTKWGSWTNITAKVIIRCQTLLD